MDGWSYSLQASEGITALRVGVVQTFAIEEPVGALDGQTGICQVAGEGGRGLVGDHRRISADVWGFKYREMEMSNTDPDSRDKMDASDSYS